MDASYFLEKESGIMKIALIAHDKKKEEIIELAKNTRTFLQNTNFTQPVRPERSLWEKPHSRYIE